MQGLSGVKSQAYMVFGQHSSCLKRLINPLTVINS
jgi:hypothetical protein